MTSAWRQDPDSLIFRLYHSRPVIRARSFIAKVKRRWRYGAIPAGGWGKGWRRLVFRFTSGARETVEVLAPIDGLGFDWEGMRPYTRGERPWPAFEPTPGRITGTMGWAGHHTFVVIGEESHRLSPDKLIPGTLRGGSQRGLTLIAVEDPGIARG